MSYSPLTPLNGRIAVVTGGTRGIGFESAKALQENGAKVIVIGLDAERGEVVSKTLGVDYFKGDVRRGLFSLGCQQLLHRKQPRHGRRIYLLVTKKFPNKRAGESEAATAKPPEQPTQGQGATTSIWR
jgi:NAD(P)-dependent dehydrogenase (short-subunit alcohol dehydrogenase family)